MKIFNNLINKIIMNSNNSNNSKIKKIKVSVLLMKKSNKEKIKIDKKDVNNILKNKKIDKNNLFSQNYLKISQLGNSFQKNLSNLKNDKRNIKSDTYRNIKVQTSLSSGQKKYRTPYQILHFKNKILKDILDYSKNNHQNKSRETNFNKKLIKIRPYSTNKDNIRYEKLLIPNLKKSLLQKIKNTDNISDKRFILKNIIKNKNNFNRNFSLNTVFSYNNISNNIDLKNNNKLLYKNEIDLKRYEKLLKVKLKMKPIKAFKPNCYYNKLNLEKITNILRKYSYADI